MKKMLLCTKFVMGDDMEKGTRKSANERFYRPQNLFFVIKVSDYYNT